MSFYDCPHCKKPAASFSIYCGLLFFGSYKKCRHCSGRIKLNMSSFFSFYIFVIVFFSTFGIFIPLLIPGILGPIGGPMTLAAFVFLFGIQFFIPDLVHHFFGIYLFDKGTD
jgi:hypothetical protein